MIKRKSFSGWEKEIYGYWMFWVGGEVFGYSNANGKYYVVSMGKEVSTKKEVERIAKIMAFK